MVEEELQMTRTAGKLATYVFSGIFASYIVAFFGTVAITRLLAPPQFGLVSLALFVPVLLMLAGDFGVSNAVTKLVAESRGKGTGNESKLIYTGLFFDAGLGAGLSAVGILLSSFISGSIFLKPEVASLVTLASIHVFSLTMYNFTYAAMLGLENAAATGAMLPVYYLLQYSLGPILVLEGFGPGGVIVGYIVGPLVSSLVALMVLWRRVPPAMPSVGVLRAMVSYGAPVSGGNILTSLLGTFYNFMAGRFASATELGYYSAATRLSFINSLVVSPIKSASLPPFSKLDLATQKATIGRLFYYALKFLVIFQAPLAIWLVLLAPQLVLLIFGQPYVGSAPYLILYALGWLYVGGGEALLQNVVLGSGNTRYIARYSLYTLVSGVALGVVLIPPLGVTGLLLTYLVAFWPPYLLLLKYVRKLSGVSFPVGPMLRIYAASVVAAIPVAIVALLPFAYYFQVFISAILMVLVYLLALPKLGGVDSNDLVVLENLMSGIPVLNRVVRLFIQAIKRLL